MIIIVDVLIWEFFREIFGIWRKSIDFRIKEIKKGWKTSGFLFYL